MNAVTELRERISATRACRAIGVARSRIYRRRKGAVELSKRPERPTPARALSEAERAAVRGVLNSEEFVDMPPRAVYAKLLDRRKYLCHWRTMYRILADSGEVRERRAVRQHPKHVKPELVARAPKRVWTWDISKLKGPVKGEFYYLYTIIDIYSRYVPGWMIADHESEVLARRLVQETATKEGIESGALTLHSDRGGPMVAGTMADLLAKLGIAKSHGRPRVSNDNPFSEAHFKTMKYRPDCPKRFNDMEHARGTFRRLYAWYNHEHYHSALELLTPAMVHAGKAAVVQAQRQGVLSAAYEAHPERYVNGPPSVNPLPAEVWINEPALELPANPSDASARDAPIQATEPGAQAGARAANGRAQRSLAAAEHPATEVVVIPPLVSQPLALQ
jgi:putative transposase